MKILSYKATNNPIVINGKLQMVKPYNKLWGFTDSKNIGESDLYDYLYYCLSLGLEKPGADGGDASSYKPGFRRLVIDLIDYTSYTQAEINTMFTRVVRDNPMLCYYSAAGRTYSGNTVSFYVPNTEQRNHAIQIINDGLELIINKVGEVCGVLPGDILLEDDKRNVVKVIHDWIVENSDYKGEAEADESEYWSQTAYSVFAKAEGVAPVCAGFSMAVLVACQMYRIPCIYVGGFTGVYPFDDTATYKVKDKVLYQGIVYRCTTAVTTPGPWTGATNWTAAQPKHAWNMLSFTLPYGTYNDNPNDWTPLDITGDDGLHRLLFSEEKTYAVNVQVSHDSNLYRCIRAIETPGPWNPDDWEQLTTSDDINAWYDFCSYNVYNSELLYPGRYNSYRNFPVDVPAKYYKYYGGTLYDITEWSAN